MRESLETYVERLLYDEEKGYYTKVKGFGRKGDFYTASYIGKLFGYTFANYFKKIWEEPVRILEIGAGEGYFKDDVVEYFKIHDVRFEYYILERNNLKYVNATRIQSLSEIKPFEGIIFQNEVLDAIPFRRFIFKDGKWHEIYVEDESRFVVGDEVKLDILPDGVDEGIIYDVSTKALDFLKEQVDVLSKGYIIIVDYGYERDELLKRFPEGSLTAYYKHTVSDDIFSHKYEKDITYFVDWTLLKQYMEGLGMELIYFKTQGEFLMENGIVEIYNELSQSLDELQRYKLGNSLKTLVFDFHNFFVAIFKKR